jgi:hypothetical protein
MARGAHGLEPRDARGIRRREPIGPKLDPQLEAPPRRPRVLQREDRRGRCARGRSRVGRGCGREGDGL